MDNVTDARDELEQRTQGEWMVIRPEQAERDDKPYYVVTKGRPMMTVAYDLTLGDATLFAAAPDLYAAAKAMLAHMDWWLQDEATNIADADASKKLYDQLTAAVAKAEWRTL